MADLPPKSWQWGTGEHDDKPLDVDGWMCFPVTNEVAKKHQKTTIVVGDTSIRLPA